jgi:putative transposase
MVPAAAADPAHRSEPGFAGPALDRWPYERGIALRLTEAGKLTQNANVGCFAGKFRDEYLNEHRLRSLAKARAIVAAWRVDYSEWRLRSALGYRTLAEHAAGWQARQRDGDER